MEQLTSDKFYVMVRKGGKLVPMLRTGACTQCGSCCNSLARRIIWEHKVAVTVDSVRKLLGGLKRGDELTEAEAKDLLRNSLIPTDDPLAGIPDGVIKDGSVLLFLAEGADGSVIAVPHRTAVELQLVLVSEVMEHPDWPVGQFDIRGVYRYLVWDEPVGASGYSCHMLVVDGDKHYCMFHDPEASITASGREEKLPQINKPILCRASPLGPAELGIYDCPGYRFEETEEQ
jgi:hypothetical protein